MAECKMNSAIIYPQYIEELIPHDIKEMYGITTQTQYIKPTIDVEPHQVRSIEIVNADKWLRTFMKERGIDTKKRQKDNLDKIFEWAKEAGLNIHIIKQEG